MFEYVEKAYGVKYHIGQRVTAYGKPGTIVKDFGHYIGVRLDEVGPKGFIGRYHPVDGIEPILWEEENEV